MSSQVTATVGITLALASEAQESNVRAVYISNDERFKELLEYKIATWINYIYGPLCAGLGILGNTAALCVLLSSKLFRGSVSVYLASLSISDSLFQIVNILFLVQHFPFHEVLRHGTCGFIYFLMYFSSLFSAIVMVGMTVDRYLAIRFPLKVGEWSTPRRARIVVAAICVFTVLISCHQLFIMKMKWNDVLKKEICVADGAHSELFMGKIWPWINSTIYCYVPFISLAVLNVLIIRQMRSADKFRGTSGSANQLLNKCPSPVLFCARYLGEERADGARHFCLVITVRQHWVVNCAVDEDVSRQVTVMLLLVTFAFLLFVGPMAVIKVVENYFWVRSTLQDQAVYYLTRTIINNLCYTNHAINFGLYCLSGKRFRQEFLRLLCPCLYGRNESEKGGRDQTQN